MASRRGLRGFRGRFRERARAAGGDPPYTDVIMAQGDGKGTAMRPEHRRIAAAFDETGRRDPQRTRQRVFLVDGNKQQIPPSEPGSLMIRAVVVNGDLDDYVTYYKDRYRHEHHFTRDDKDTTDRLNLAA